MIQRWRHLWYVIFMYNLLHCSLECFYSLVVKNPNSLFTMFPCLFVIFYNSWMKIVCVHQPLHSLLSLIVTVLCQNHGTFYIHNILIEKGKFANIGFAMVESHVQIRENPKASRRCDGQSLSFHLKQNAGCLHVHCVWTKVVA